MKRIIHIAVLLLFMGASQVNFAQETNSDAAPAPARVSLLSLAQKNIFDPTRTGRVRPNRPGPRPPVVRRYAFTFSGVVDDAALFTGEGAGKGYLKAGKTINGFKVMQVNLDSVKLIEPNGKIVVLNTDDTMRREGDGPWLKSDEPVSEVMAIQETKPGDAVASPIPAAAAAENDVLKRLRLKREQEDK
jgi:hypothetical protein